ncbi:MAG: hypothetical protein K8H74_02865 [Notoacmeibacter sp.]|nr:hypothetical protein [Notoacmeibacter sp.]
MKLFARKFFARRAVSTATAAERRRFAKSMGGEIAAVSAARLGCIV